MSYATSLTRLAGRAARLRAFGKRLFRRQIESLVEPSVRAADEEYRGKCLEAFGEDVRLGQNYLFWTLPFGSPETRQLYQAMSQIEFGLFGRWLQILRDERIPGAIAEFGVWQGNGLEQIIIRCEALDLLRPVFGFDSFEGLPEPSSDDLECFKAGEFLGSIDDVSARLKVPQRPHVRLVKGWFCDSLRSPEVANEPGLAQVAFARIDGDLYESTVDCLNFLEGRLAHGCFLVFDDWAHKQDLGETKAFFEFFERTKNRYRFEHMAALGMGSLHLRVWQR
jgi:hypothetical protein